MGRLVLGLASKASDSEPKLAHLGAASSAAVRADGASAEWVTVRAASVAGVRHRLAGDHSDDFYAWSLGEDLIAIAVADGLGSIPGSAEAAARACRAAVTGATATGATATRATAATGVPAAGAARGLAVAMRAAFTAANTAAAGGGATTLVVALVSRDGSVEVGRVGDSTAFILRGGEASEMFPAPADDIVGTETLALPVADDGRAGGGAALQGADFWEASGDALGVGDVVVLASDGVADPWRDGPQTVGPAMSGVVTGFPSPLELAAAVDFSRQGCHDDRTLLCVWLRPG